MNHESKKLRAALIAKHANLLDRLKEAEEVTGLAIAESYFLDGDIFVDSDDLDFEFKGSDDETLTALCASADDAVEVLEKGPEGFADYVMGIVEADPYAETDLVNSLDNEHEMQQARRASDWEVGQLYATLDDGSVYFSNEPSEGSKLICSDFEEHAQLMGHGQRAFAVQVCKALTE